MAHFVTTMSINDNNEQKHKSNISIHRQNEQ